MAKHTKKKCRSVRGQRVCRQTRRAQKSRKDKRRGMKSKRGGMPGFSENTQSERQAYMSHLMNTVYKGKTLSQSMKSSMARWVQSGN